MGVDTELYIDNRWELDDIKTVIERIAGENIKVSSYHTTSVGFYHFTLPKMGRSIDVFVNARTPIGTATLLTLESDDEAHKLFESIAEIFGGIYMENDSDGKCRFITGAVDDGDKLPYFIKYAIIEDNIDPDDIKEFIMSMNKWYKRVTSAKKPAELDYIIKKCFSDD